MFVFIEILNPVSLHKFTNILVCSALSSVGKKILEEFFVSLLCKRYLNQSSQNHGVRQATTHLRLNFSRFQNPAFFLNLGALQ